MTGIRARAIILAVWAATTAWLIRYEAFPEAFSRVFSGYSHAFADGRYIMDSWMRIVFHDATIGYLHTWVDSRPEELDETYVAHNRTAVNLNLMGMPQSVNMNSSVFLDAQYRLRRFSFFMGSGMYTLRISGVRIGDETFDVKLHTAGGVQQVRVTIPEEAVIYSPMTQAAVAGLQPGGEMRIRAFDPVTMGVSDVTIRALRRETITVGGVEREATALSVAFQGVETLAWVDEKGETLRQETPFGWVMEACSPGEILNPESGPKPMAADMLATLAVPCDGAIDEKSPELRLKLSAPAAIWTPWENERQRIVARDDSGVTLDIRAQWPPRGLPAAAPTPADAAEFLKPTLYVQSDNERIVKKAREITADLHSAWEKALAINRWVHKNISKQPTASVPSAVDVLANRQGDCNEHTYLFAALARAAGVPARIHVGLAYYEGGFYYHAWPAVHVGEWIETDPTLGLDTVGASHITLLTGELTEQFKLGAMAGRISISVLPPDDAKR